MHRLYLGLICFALFITSFYARPDLNGPSLYYAAQRQLGVTTSYDPTYRRLAYPNGDVSKHTGVCTDVIIRAFRVLGVDLQKEVHEDMKANWNAYPKLWGLTKPDPNIDHRRVPNLMTYFKRKCYQVFDTYFKTGDIVVVNLGNNILHICIVSNNKPLGHDNCEKPRVIHNIANGVEHDGILCRYPVIAKYRIK